MADVADKRELRQFRQTPEQRFALEQEHLQPLPDTDFDTTPCVLGQLYRGWRQSLQRSRNAVWSAGLDTHIAE